MMDELNALEKELEFKDKVLALLFHDDVKQILIDHILSSDEIKDMIVKECLACPNINKTI